MGTLHESTLAVVSRESTQLCLLGDVHGEHDGRRVVLHGSQPRLVVVYLAIHRSRSIPAGELAEMLWPQVRSGHWEGAIRGVISKVRAFLHELGPGAPTIDGAGHTYRFVEGNAAALDIGQAERELVEAANHLAVERWDAAAAAACMAATRLGETLLPGLDSMWIDHRRAELLRMRCRAHRIAAVANTRCARFDDAIRLAEAAAADDVFDEQNHRTLMDAHVAAGNRGAALRAYGRCRRILAEQLGVSPSGETERLYLRILAQDMPDSAATTRRMLPTVADRPFVGRARELAVITGAWDRAQISGCQIVFIHGEAGIGKTRLALEAVHSLQVPNVLYGCCGAEQIIALEPFAEAIGRYTDRIGTAELAEVIKGFATELAAVVPSIAARLECPPGRRAGYGPSMFEAIGAVLARVAATSPTVLIIDDLHWADPSSLLVVRHILRMLDHARMLVLIAYRDDCPPSAAFAHAIGEIHRLDGCHATRLLGLEAAEIRELFDSTATRPHPSEFGDMLRERTGGNCFYLTQLLSAAVDDPGPFDPCCVPDTLSEVVRHRVMTLTTPARRTLAMAAVIGVDVPRSLLEHAVTRDGDGTEAIDELVERHLLLEVETGGWRFAHPIVRDVVYAQLSRSRRRRLHGAVASAPIPLTASMMPKVRRIGDGRAPRSTAAL